MTRHARIGRFALLLPSLERAVRRQPTARRKACHRQPLLDALEDRVVLSSATVSLGSAAEYAVLGLGKAQIDNASATIHGDVGVSHGGTLKNARRSIITGNVFTFSQGQYSGHGELGGSVNVAPAQLTQADQDARNAASQAASLAPTQTFHTIKNATTITGNGGVNVIDVNGNISASLTLTGTASDVFIINVTGNLTLKGNESLGLGGGVTADHVLYNFTGAGATVSTHSGNLVDGTLLAPDGSFNVGGTFNGEIIGGRRSTITLADAQVSEVSFSSGPVITSISGAVTLNSAPVSGVTVTLTGVDNQNNQVTVTATTDANGAFTFSGLAAGTYTIQQPPVTSIENQTTVGTDNGVTDGTLEANGDIGSIVLAAGDQAINYDFNLIFFTA